MAKKVLTLTALREEHAKLIREYNEKIGKPETKAEEKLALDKKIIDVEEEYAHRKMLAIYKEVETSADPVASFVARERFYSLTHKVKKEKVRTADGVEVEITKGYEVVDDTKGEKKGKMIRLDLVDFCTRTKRSLGFKSRVAKLNKLLYIWGMKKLNASDDAILAKNSSDYTKEQLKLHNEHMKQATMEDGTIDHTRAQIPDPISGKSLLTKLQECYDLVPTVETFTADANKIGALKLTYTTETNDPLKINMRTDAPFLRLFQNVLHSTITKQAVTINDFSIDNDVDDSPATEGNGEETQVSKADGEETAA